MLLLSFKRGEETTYAKRIFQRSKQGRAPINLEYDYHSLFSVNSKISILVKSCFLNTYYLNNSFLQSQARKCS